MKQLLIEFEDGKAFFGLEVAFAAKPVFHGGAKAVEGDAAADFEQAVRGGKRVVEDGVVSEVAHGEVVDPVDGAWVRRTGSIDSLDGEAAQEHAFTLTDERLTAVGSAQDASAGMEKACSLPAGLHRLERQILERRQREGSGTRLPN